MSIDRTFVINRKEQSVDNHSLKASHLKTHKGKVDGTTPLRKGVQVKHHLFLKTASKNSLVMQKESIGEDSKESKQLSTSNKVSYLCCKILTKEYKCITIQ